MAQNPKLLRPLFIGAWFFVAPLGLALVAIQLLRAPPDLVPTDLLGIVRGFVRDQEVPAAIVLFTFFEMLLWSFRHQLPLADRLGVAGRLGLPREVRDDFEAAAHLVEEIDRILGANTKAVARELPKATREELDEAVEGLRRAMAAEPFDVDGFHDAHDRVIRRARSLERWRKSELREYVESIGVAVLVAVLLRAVVVEAFKIPSGSMLPTLQIGDHIFVNKFVYGPMVPFTTKRLLSRMPPERGDVIVFENPDHPAGEEGEDYIKRVIAVPGDVLEAQGGHPIINGWRVPSCLVGTYAFYERPDHPGTSFSDGVPPTTGELYVEFLGAGAHLAFYQEPALEQHQGPYEVKDGEVWVFGDNRHNSRDSRAWFGERGGGVPYDSIKGRAMFVWLPAERFLVNVMGSPQLPKGAPRDMVDGIARCLAHRPALSETTPPARAKPR